MKDASQLIDWNQFATLKSDMGEDGIDAVIDIFLSEMDELLAALFQPNELKSIFHAIKGSAANLGFCAVVMLSSKLEREGATEQDIKNLAALYAQSKDAFQNALDQEF